MSEEQLTPDEAQALEAMEKDTGEITDEPVVEEEPEKEAEPAKAEEEPKEPEFKSSRTEEKPPEGFVPHQAMHSERLKRQEAERKLAEYEAKAQEAAEAEQAPQFVDPLEDPEGFRKYQDWRDAQFEKRIQQNNEVIQQQQQDRAVYLDVQRSEAEFSQKMPDYPDAMNHLHSTRVAELQSMGYPPQQIDAQIAKDVRAIYDAAKPLGMNPAELAYMRAQSLGYQKAATPAPQAAPAASEADKVQALANAAEQASGVGSAGAPQEGALTVAQLAKMSEADIAALPDDQFEKVMGG